MKIRLINLMKILVESEEILTVSDLAEKLEVSKKTIRNDLHSCKIPLDEMKLELIKKSGVGIYVEGSPEAKLEALNKLKRQTTGLMGYGSIERQLLIIKKLLFGKKKISLHWLEMNLYVSKTSIYKDLDLVSKWFLDRDIEIEKDKYGRFYLESGEKRIRKAIFDWRSLCNKSLSIDGKNEMVKETIIGREFAYERSIKVARRIESIFEIKLVPEDFNGLIYKLAIALDRMQEGYYVTLKRDTLDRLTSLELYDQILEVSSYIEGDFCIQIPESEKGYILGLIVSLKIYEGKEGWNIDRSYIDINKKIAKLITVKIHENLNITDKKLVSRRVEEQVITLSNQINYGLYSFHPLAEKVCENYDYTKKLVETFIPIYEEKMNYSLAISDISEWLIIIARLIEETKRRLEAIFIYSHKYSDAILSVKTLRNNFNQVNIIKLVSVDSFEEEAYTNLDLIFIDDVENNVYTKFKSIVVPPLLSSRDKLKIYDRVSRYYEDINRNEIKKTI